MTNGFERAARMRKVLALLAMVPAGETAEANASAAEFLSSMPAADRESFAAAAGVKSPSDETWRELVRAVRERKAMEDVWSRFDGGVR